MHKIRDGDIYKIIELHGSTFELRYGYYEEYERGREEPVPISYFMHSHLPSN